MLTEQVRDYLVENPVAVEILRYFDPNNSNHLGYWHGKYDNSEFGIGRKLKVACCYDPKYEGAKADMVNDVARRLVELEVLDIFEDQTGIIRYALPGEFLEAHKELNLCTVEQNTEHRRQLLEDIAGM